VTHPGVGLERRIACQGSPALLLPYIVNNGTRYGFRTRRGACEAKRRMGLMAKDFDKPKGADLEEARLRQQAIGVKLRQMFDDVVNEPVPDEFLDILRRADARAGGKE